MRVAVIDYGLGNLGSVSGALNALGVSNSIAREPEHLELADSMILPGVGSFFEGMAHLVSSGWVEVIRRHAHAGKPLLGICLGMQLLVSHGSEGGECPGLDLISGDVHRLDLLGCSERVPHVGWNSVVVADSCGGLLSGITENTDFYFVHSYAVCAADPRDVLATVDYGVPMVAAIGQGTVFGTQFHPEKSSAAGARVLRNFLAVRPC